MKPFLRHIALFVPVVVVLYLAVIFVAGTWIPEMFLPNLKYNPNAYGHMHSRLAEAERSGPVDVLFIGSSHAYRGFDPRIFSKAGITTFNFGSSSQTPMQSAYLLDKYLDRLRPKLLVIELFPVTLAIDGVESTLNILASDTLNADVVKMALATRNTTVFNSLVYGWMYEQLLQPEDFAQPSRMGTDQYVSGGYVEKDLAVFDPGSEFPRIDPDFRPDQLRALDRMIAVATARDVPFMIVQAPVPKVFYTTYPNADDFDREMRERGTYLNFNKLLKLNDSLDFYDYHHLNSSGVRKFNEALIREIDF